MSEENGWAEWSKHVLRELERLNDNHETLRTRIEELHQQVIKLKGSLSDLEELKTWKHNVDEVTSPSQLKTLQTDVADLKIFRARAIAIGGVLQVLVGIALAIMGLKN
jgi:predicted  nucleic acid-binding Zn-ribbon protein